MRTASAASASVRIMHAGSKSGWNWVHPCRAAFTGLVLIAVADVHLQAAIYGHLAALQGQSIPKLVASGDTGYTMAPTFKFIATQHAGAPVCEAQLETQDIDSALCSLRQVHDAAVLHGDIHTGNVIVNEEASVATAASAICCECLYVYAVCKMEHLTN